MSEIKNFLNENFIMFLLTVNERAATALNVMFACLVFFFLLHSLESTFVLRLDIFSLVNLASGSTNVVTENMASIMSLPGEIF